MLKSNDPELQGVFDFAMSLSAAVKNYMLYPQEHAIAKKHLAAINRHLSQFLLRYEHLRLDVDKNSLLYDNDIIYKGTPQESDIAYLLSRDGIQYLDFLRGIESWELQSLLTLVNRYRIIDEENDGDIATALWEQDYPHIDYKAVDVLSLAAQPFSLASFKVMPSGTVSEGTAQSNGLAPAGSQGGAVQTERDAPHPIYEDLNEISDRAEQGSRSDAGNSGGRNITIVEKIPADGPPPSIAITAKGNDLWSLSPMERIELEHMVAEAEQQDETDHVVDVLLITLLIQNREQDFSDTLAFLRDRFLRALKTSQFEVALKTLNNLRKIRVSLGRKKKWVTPLIDACLNSFSEEASLRDLKQLLASKQTKLAPQQTASLWATLELLRPAILSLFGPLLDTMPEGELRQGLFEVLMHHAQKSPQALTEAIPLLCEDLCLRLFPVIQQMSRDDSNRAFTSMALHPVENVRRQAFTLLEGRKVLDPLALMPLLNDPDEGVREKILHLIEQKRDNQIESRLLAYLEQGENSIDSKKHLLACYAALGRCGSCQSIPFLHNVLMGRDWGKLLRLGDLSHKQGAAMALRTLKLEEADALLKEGAASMVPDLRMACRKALEK